MSVPHASEAMVLNLIMIYTRIYGIWFIVDYRIQSIVLKKEHEYLSFAGTMMSKETV